MDFEELTPEEPVDLDEIMKLIEMPEDQALTADDAPVTPAVEAPKNTDTSGRNSGKKISPQKNLVLYLHDLVYLMVGIVLVFLLCFRIVVVSGDSMYDTLINGDYVLLQSNVFYNDPKPGDIVVISKESYDNGLPIIKRIIATEGQTVDIDFRRGIVFVDGVALEEDYIYSRTTTYEGVNFPLTVDEGCVFVLGDNRAKSKDSRNPQIGLVDTRQIVGRALLVIFPGTDDSGADFGRIGVIE